MRKLFIGILAIAVVFGMSMGVMAEEFTLETEAEIDQIGDENVANINQNDYSGGNSPNYVSLLQEGSWNVANFEQMGDTGVIDAIQYDAWASIMNVSQGPSWNHNATLRQRYTDSTTINLNQQSATAVLVQEHEENSTINVTQDGFGTFPGEPNKGDFVSVVQEYGSNNLVNISQTSEANDDRPRSEVFVTQEWGEDNEINISQDGRAHLATVYQTGMENTANVAQFNENNIVDISQDGEDNTVNVTQND